jgi:hypothetical protein
VTGGIGDSRAADQSMPAVDAGGRCLVV